MKYNVLIVEDDPMARQLFSMFITQSDKYEIYQAIENADLADIYCEGGKVDIIIMDIRTSLKANGLDAAERIKKRYPKIKIVIVTSMLEQSYLFRAKEIGVDSFWYKEVTSEPFYLLLDRTMAGENVYPTNTPVVKIGLANSDEFTDRELEVLRELTAGKTNSEIANKLFVSERTVKAHIQHMLEKTGFKNRTELAVKAREKGIAISDE